MLYTNKDSRLDGFCQLAITISLLLFFKDLFFNQGFIRWDTFDGYFVHFVYASDAIASGEWPFWNPLVLSGMPFTPSAFMLTSLNNPIDVLFLLISIGTNVFFSMNLMLYFACWIFAISSYKLIRLFGGTHFSAFFGALASLYLLTPFMLGQIYFLFSLSYLGLFFYWTAQEAFSNNTPSSQPLSFKFLFKAIFLSSLFVKSYFYLNILSMGFAFLMVIFIYFRSLPQKRYVLRKLLQLRWIILFFLPAVFAVCFFAEGFIDYKNQYADLLGDLVISEPRLRLLNTKVVRSIYDSFSTTFGVLLNLKSGVWSIGLGALAFIMIPSLAIPLYCRKNNLRKEIIIPCLAMMTFGIVFSTNFPHFIKIARHIPLIKYNHWFNINLYYTTWAFCILSSLCLGLLNFKFKKFIEIGCGIILAAFIYFDYNSYIVGLHTPEIEGTDHAIIHQKISERPLSNTVRENKKTRANYIHFVSDQYPWLYYKTPYTHGYNPSVSEIYWRMKDAPFMEKIVSFGCQTHTMIQKPRLAFESDNKYQENKIANVDPAGESILLDREVSYPNCTALPYSIQNFKMTSNRLEFDIETPQPGLAFITQHYHDGWTAKVNDVPVEIYKTNFILSGIDLKSSGKFHIEMNYFPKTLYVLLVLYIGLVLWLILLFRLRSKRR